MSSHTKDGILFTLAGVATMLFVSFLGQFSVFGNYKKFVVAYNFVGGLEEGSHVRLMGVKVGKVYKVEFKPDYKHGEEEVKLHIHVKVKEEAFNAIRTDSKYFINMAGIIGEKYLEITPGASAQAQLEEGTVVRGIDPPRVDQLISQGYALAGKILSVVEDNEGSVTDTIGSISDLVKSLNKVLGTIDKMTTDEQYTGLVKEFGTLSKEMNILLRDANRGDLHRVIDTMRKLLGKLDKIDEKEIRAFLQEEGIKARVAL
ncbi:MAG: MCE family protein [Bdellovibrionales bacterium]|nr:MlaD family protein [Bdellovibrionales bacterium]NQZ18837.1 MCE family protein [Bdellovibrionales bacterium]